MSAYPIPRLSPERYLEIERGNDFRSEYYDGQMFAMSGGTPAHAIIISNLSGELRQSLKHKPCTVAANELRVCVTTMGLYTYPDVVVVWGDMAFAAGTRDTITNPRLIVEVLSKSTEAYDRGRKFLQYRRVESLEEYVLVTQSEPRVEVFSRQPDGSWLLKEYSGMDSSCICKSIDCTIPLAEIYHKISFEAVSFETE
jgi:Uma2 family endonuclease